MLRYLDKVVGKRPNMPVPPPPGTEAAPATPASLPAPAHAPRLTFAISKALEPLRFLGRVARRRPKTAALILTIGILLGAGAGLYGYALRQWQAAQTAIKNGRPAQAQEKLPLCLFVWPRSVRVHLLAARAARMRGDFQDAEAHLNRCLELQRGEKADIQLEFLLMRAQAGQEDAVRDDLLAYVENKHPDTPLILESLARAYMHSFQYAPALFILNRWIREEPDAAKAYYWRGWVMEMNLEHQQAAEDYHKALELDPDLVEVRIRVAEMALERNDAEEALPLLERLCREYPDRADVSARLGQCRFLQGRDQEARVLLEGALEKMPNDPALLLHLAKLELNAAKPAEAEKWLRRALEVNPYDLEARYILVTSLEGQDRRDEAKAALSEHREQKRLLERANKLLRDEVARSPNDPKVAYEVGDIFLHIGQERLGVYWLSQALKLDDSYKPAHQALADYYESKDDHDAAARHRRWLAAPEGKSAKPSERVEGK
jgi:tetratricopeptide (TPR) repeat protein